jgi:DNA-binding IclR family transcriptional regulator
MSPSMANGHANGSAGALARNGSSAKVVVLAPRAARASGGQPLSSATRGLSTARAVLRVLSYMTQHPDGVTAREVAQELGKSVSTAYYLLASLHEEGFAIHEPGRGYRLRAEAEVGAAAAAPSRGNAVAHTVEELFARTHRRSYLGRVEAGTIVITATCGRQGIPRVPGLEPRIGRSAHAVAMGKVVLSLLPDQGRRRYIERGLHAYTLHTITSPAALLSELDQVRSNGLAIDRGEFDSEYCSVAAPVLGERGRFLAVLGLSTSSRAFEAEAQDLVRAVRQVAAVASGGAVQRRRGITPPSQTFIRPEPPDG